MWVLHVITSVSLKSGGPSRSSQGLIAALCKAGVDAWIYSFDGSTPWIQGVRSFEVWKFGGLEIAVREFDLVHIHGIWDLRLHKVAVMCRKAGVPYVIAPRGMLEPWSLKQKWLKKRIARFLYQDRDLKLAAALHATAESEAEQFRRLGFKNPIIVSPNGVNVPEGKVFQTQRTQDFAEFDCDHTATASPVANLHSAKRLQRRALFVSRMHPKKGVLELVESWARVKNEVKVRGEGERWCVELVYTMNSEEERAYEQNVKDRILALGMSYGEMVHGALSVTSGKDSASPLTAGQLPDFIFTGALDDEKKWEAYGRADLFVLPTYSENFGIVVAEALWAGVPVITTKGTPWAELECSASSKFKVQSSKLEERCGWWIELPEARVKVKGVGVEWMALDFALREAFEHSNNPNIRTILPDMGLRGHELVEERYTWSAVCAKLISGYKELLRDWQHLL